MPLHSDNGYAALADSCSLRRLETPCVYNRETDDLYELDEQAFLFLLGCNGVKRLSDMDGDPDFIRYCLDEKIIATYPTEHIRHIAVHEPPGTSLRYLELHLTGRCNLRCRHCYLSGAEERDMDLFRVFKSLDDFDSMQGLRAVLSGGEPLLHKGFWYINERLSVYGFRSALLSNGSLITKEVANRLKVNEVQISIDGMKKAHDRLRGEGVFSKAVRAVERLTDAGINVSVATTVNRLNRADFEEMSMLMDSLGVAEWNIDMPSAAGRLMDNKELMLSPEEAAPYMSLGRGGGHHGSSDGFACGSHLCAIGTGGQVAKCGFFMDRPVGNVAEGLDVCWSRLKPMGIGSLNCSCEFVEACKGGCRFRAASYSDEFGPDPVMCYNLGVMAANHPTI